MTIVYFDGWSKSKQWRYIGEMILKYFVVEAILAHKKEDKFIGEEDIANVRHETVFSEYLWYNIGNTLLNLEVNLNT